MRLVWRLAVLAPSVVCLLAVTAPAADTPATQETSLDAIAVPTLDLLEIIKQLGRKNPTREPTEDPHRYKKPIVTVAPAIGYNPATGFSIGIGASAAFFRGDPETTHISAALTSLRVTTKDQVVFNTRANVFGADDRWNFVSDTRANWTNQDTYGLGTSTTPDQAVNVKYNYLRLFENGYKQIRRHLFAGAGFLYSGYTDIRPNPSNPAGLLGSSFVRRSNEFGFDLVRQRSAGASLNALVDSRDNSINPSRGFYADLKYQMYFAGFLGGTSTWQLSHGDLRKYVRLTRDARQRLAFWLFGDLVTGGTAPYFDLPTTGGDTYGRSGRGYAQGRFRGERMLYGEIEYRWTITQNGLLGMVAFLNTETLSNQEAGEKLFDSFATGAGAGLRLMLSKRSKTNLSVDFGQGKAGSRGLYVGVREAF
ncbi:MAG: BamA/TamA family outer membrane protein [Vicinamibacteria bacterium]